MTGAVAALAGMGGGLGFLNPVDKAATLTLSNGNRTATNSGGTLGVARSVTGRSGSKFYFEIESGGSGNNGLCTPTKSLTEALDVAGGIGLSPFGAVTINGAAGTGTDPSAVGSTIRFALDLTTRKLWVAVNGGAWNTGDPAAGTGGDSFSAITGALHAAVQPGGSAIVRLLQRHWAYAAPTGFAPWG